MSKPELNCICQNGLRGINIYPREWEDCPGRVLDKFCWCNMKYTGETGLRLWDIFRNHLLGIPSNKPRPVSVRFNNLGHWHFRHPGNGYTILHIRRNLSKTVENRLIFLIVYPVSVHMGLNTQARISLFSLSSIPFSVVPLLQLPLLSTLSDQAHSFSVPVVLDEPCAPGFALWWVIVHCWSHTLLI